jgi:hypothetical protein
MTPRIPVRFALPLALGFACSAAGSAQQLIGYINARDANITGATDELDGRAVLVGSVSITAKDHTAPITLGRGGTVSVCQTSVLHVTESRAVAVAAPLLFSLDRGAIEILTSATPNDAIMTPDLRFTVRNSGPLDLRMRVARNGDTCVENRGLGAPTLAVSDPFGESMYELAAGQHVLFEHGSLHEVVDRESMPCGCPEPKGLSMADTLLASNAGAKSGPPTPVPTTQTLAPADMLAEHPFPAAISEGLAPPEELPPIPANQTQPQISEPLVYNGITKDPDALPPQNPAEKAKPLPPPSAPVATLPVTPPSTQIAAVTAPEAPPLPPAPAPQPAAAPAPAPPVNDLVHGVGRLFHKLFGRH